jgi:hypothetical protein
MFNDESGFQNLNPSSVRVFKRNIIKIKVEAEFQHASWNPRACTCSKMNSAFNV